MKTQTARLLASNTAFRGWGNCEVCGNPIKNPATATISVCYKQLRKYERKRKAWEDKNVEDYGGLQAYRLGADCPERIEWAIAHEACGCPYHPEGCDEYWFYCSRFDTYDKVLGWTLHLMEKVWFMATDWETLIRRLYTLPAD